MSQLNEEDQSKLKGQEKRNDKIARRSRQRKNCSGEYKFSKKKDQTTSKRNRKFIPLSKSNEKMLHFLIIEGRITKLLPPINPKIKSFDSTKICLYHSNSHGHATEGCWSLRHKIQDLIENRELKIESPMTVLNGVPLLGNPCTCEFELCLRCVDCVDDIQLSCRHSFIHRSLLMAV